MKKYFFILIPLLLFAQQNEKIDKILFGLKGLESEEVVIKGDTLISLLYNSEKEEGKIISEYLQKRLPEMNFNLLYGYVLIHSWRFYNFEKRLELLNKAYSIAKNLENKKLITTAEIFKAIAFKENNYPDSAMYYALKARDNLANSDNSDDLNTVNNLIADLHYYAGQYDKAEILYRQLLNTKSVKNTWMYNIIQNNIGLIRIKQKKYDDAKTYFTNSLKNLTSKKMTYTDSAALPYYYRILLEITYKQRNYKEAARYFFLAQKTSERFGQQNYLPVIYTYKGLMLLEKAKLDSAIIFLERAKNLNEKSPQIENSILIYSGLAKAYGSLKDYKKANYYVKLQNQAETTADSIFYKTRYMTNYAEYNYNKYLAEIKNYKQRQTILIIVTLIIIVSLITIIYFFLRLRKTNKALIAKNIEAAFSTKNISLPNTQKIVENDLVESSTELVLEENNNEISNQLDEELSMNIINGLEKLMNDEKLYLQNDITLDKVSILLHTNRLYLSKAINNTYKINFNVYINDLRIKEAIRIISSGDHKNLNVFGIANKCGFNNRVSFTKAFYKHTGVYPSYFMKHGEFNKQEIMS